MKILPKKGKIIKIKMGNTVTWTRGSFLEIAKSRNGPLAVRGPQDSPDHSRIRTPTLKILPEKGKIIWEYKKKVTLHSTVNQ